MTHVLSPVAQAPVYHPRPTGGLALRPFAALAAAFIMSGTLSTVAVKWGNSLRLPGRGGRVSEWEHPFCQTLVMFLCELLCLGLFAASKRMAAKSRRKNSAPKVSLGLATEAPSKALYFLPALCDLTASTMDYVGLWLTTASAYQMLRGGIILFTAIFARIFLRRRFQLYQSVGIGLVVLGLTVVGVSTVVSSDGEEAVNPALGNVIVIVAQLFYAAQNVLEEMIFAQHSTDPMELVGWEGLFGGAMMFVALLVMLPIGGRPDDIWDWALQTTSSWKPALSLVMLAVAVPTFNTAGNALTKYVSATTRMALGSLRNILIWGLSMAFFGETFKWLQLCGFVLLVLGVAVFQHVIILPHSTLQHCVDESSDSGTGSAQGSGGGECIVVEHDADSLGGGSTPRGSFINGSVAEAARLVASFSSQSQRYGATDGTVI